MEIACRRPGRRVGRDPALPDQPAALKGSFPVWTLLTNLLGAVAIGFIAGASARGRMQDVAALFWKTGVCGGFTTFSTFSLEAFSLLENGNRGLGALYILLSILLCLGGIALGQAAAGALLKTAAT